MMVSTLRKLRNLSPKENWFKSIQKKLRMLKRIKRYRKKNKLNRSTTKNKLSMLKRLKSLKFTKFLNQTMSSKITKNIKLMSTNTSRRNKNIILFQ